MDNIFGTDGLIKPRYGLLESLANNTILPTNQIYQGMDAEGELTWSKQLELVMYGQKITSQCWSNTSLDSFEGATEGLGFGPFSLKINNNNTYVYRSEFMRKLKYREVEERSKYSALASSVRGLL